METKPCPFCGSEAEILEIFSHEPHEYLVRCKNRECRCKLEMWYESRTECIEAWNRRQE